MSTYLSVYSAMFCDLKKVLPPPTTQLNHNQRPPPAIQPKSTPPTRHTAPTHPPANRHPTCPCVLVLVYLWHVNQLIQKKKKMVLPHLEISSPFGSVYTEQREGYESLLLAEQYLNVIHLSPRNIITW